MLCGLHGVVMMMIVSFCVWNTASWCDHLRNRVGIELAGDLESKLLLVSDQSRFKHGVKLVGESVVLPWKVPETG